MQNLLISVTLFWLLGCRENSPSITHNPVPENSRPVTIKLIDSLGYVSCLMPVKYDTFFHWTDRSDCGKPCDKQKYRSQPKVLPINKESGFFNLVHPADSVEQFTIIHSGWFPFREVTDTNAIADLHLHAKQDIVSSPETYKIKFDTLENINDRRFSIIVIDLYDTATGVFSKKVIGLTTVKGNGIAFQYKLLTRRNDSITTNFIKNSLQFIRTIKLNNGI